MHSNWSSWAWKNISCKYNECFCIFTWLFFTNFCLLVNNCLLVSQNLFFSINAQTYIFLIVKFALKQLWRNLISRNGFIDHYKLQLQYYLSRSDLKQSYHEFIQSQTVILKKIMNGKEMSFVMALQFVQSRPGLMFWGSCLRMQRMGRPNYK